MSFYILIGLLALIFIRLIFRASAEKDKEKETLNNLINENAFLHGVTEALKERICELEKKLNRILKENK